MIGGLLTACVLAALGVGVGGVVETTALLDADGRETGAVVVWGTTETGASLMQLVEPVPRPGDLDGDGDVTASDLVAYAQRFGRSDPAADLDGNDVVDGFDLAAFLDLLFAELCRAPAGPTHHRETLPPLPALP